MNSPKLDDLEEINEQGYTNFLLESDFNSKKESKLPNKYKRIFYLLAGLAILVTVVLLIVFLIPRDTLRKPDRPNVIFFIGDGFGPASATMARIASGGRNGNLSIDPYLVGTLRTFSYDSFVTDSAAGATAYAAGIHTYNRGISIDPVSKKAVGAIIDAAHSQGMPTGLVVTTRLSDATPACFYAHSTDRQYEEFIISQILGKDIKVMLGGGRSKWNSTVLDKARQLNYTLASTAGDMANAPSNQPLIGLFNDGDLPYEIDRVTFGMTNIPTLKEMTIKALDVLTNTNVNNNAFFLMVEGSQIDVAGHSNDAATQIRETLAYTDAFQAALDFASKNGNTIIISTADHETGGLTLGYQGNYSVDAVYQWYPDVLMNITASAVMMARFIQGNVTANTTADVPTIIQSVIGSYTSSNSVTLTNDDITLIQSFIPGIEWNLAKIVGKVLSSKASVGFTTSGHTGVDVNLYAYYSGSDQSILDQLRGNHQNIFVAQYITDQLKLDLMAETLKLVNLPTTP